MSGKPDVTNKQIHGRDGTCVAKELMEVFQILPVPLVITRVSDSHILYANTLFAAMVECPLESIIELELGEFYRALPEREALLNEVQEKGHVENRELRIQRVDGTVIWALVSIYAITYDTTPALLIVLQDISERKQVELALEQKHFLLRTLIDQLPDFVYVKDIESRFILTNQALARAVGANDPEDMIHQTDSDFFPQDLAAQYLADETTVFRTGQPLVDQEEMFVDKYGDRRLILTTKVPLFDQDGSVYGLVGTGRDITVHRRAEEELRKLSRAVEQSPGIIYITDAEGRIEYVNRKFAEITGYSADEAMGRFPRVLDPTKNSLEECEERWNVIRSGREWRGEFQNRKKNGEPFWETVSISSIKDDTGAIAHFVILMEDITERKLMEQALRHGEARFRAIVSAMPDLLFRISRQGIFLDATAPDESVLVAPVDQIVGSSLETVLPLEVSDMLRTAIQDALNMNTSTAVEYVIPINTRMMHMEGRVVVSGPDEVLLIVRDITESKRIQEALAHERNLLRTLINHLPDFIYVKDTAGRFVVSNGELARSMGAATPDELIGKTDADYYPPNVIAPFYADEQAVLRSGQPLLNREEPLLDRAGNRVGWILTSKVPWRDEQGQVTGLVGISRDITEQRQTAEKLKQQAEELARSNKELEQFAYVASHDLQEPLRMVTSYLQLLERRYADRLDSDAHEFIAYAVDGATRMKTLINDLLTYSRVGTRGKPFEPTDCNMILAQALANLQASIEENQAVITHGRLPIVNADGTQLIQLFQNLISNAIKFRRENAPNIHVGVEYQSGEWKFSVRDNGIGIDPAYNERIFIIFQRLHGKQEYPGTGIGLAISKKIVERHGGQIWPEPRSPHGTTFYFTIPAIEGETDGSKAR